MMEDMAGRDEWGSSFLLLAFKTFSAFLGPDPLSFAIGNFELRRPI